MKRSILLSKQNYFASKGKCDEDRFIRSNELASSRNIIYRKNPKWLKYVKSKPKTERVRLDRIVIEKRARRFEIFEKDKNRENLVLDLDAIDDEISLVTELPNLIQNWTEMKQPK